MPGTHAAPPWGLCVPRPGMESQPRARALGLAAVTVLHLPPASRLHPSLLSLPAPGSLPFLASAPTPGTRTFIDWSPHVPPWKRKLRPRARPWGPGVGQARVQWLSPTHGLHGSQGWHGFPDPGGFWVAWRSQGPGGCLCCCPDSVRAPAGAGEALQGCVGVHASECVHTCECV